MRAKKFTPKRSQPVVTMRAEAIRRLRERWEEESPDEEWEADQEPIVTPLFKACEGGIEHVLDAIRAHDDDDARAFVEEYERCSATDRKYIPLEYVAFTSGIGSLRLAEIAQTAIFLYDGMKTKLLIASHMPKVTRSIIKAATDEVPILAWVGSKAKVVGHTNGDVKAMEMFGKMAGFVPVPKGAQIQINNLGQGEDKDAAATPARPVWRESEARLREIHELTEPKRLPSPEARPIAAGGRLDHLQEDTIHILRDE